MIYNLRVIKEFVVHIRVTKRIGALAGAFAMLVTAIAAVGVASQPAHAQDGDGNVTVTLLHNNDGESKLLPDPDGGFPGIARFTAMLQDLGTETNADILLRVTSGDNFLASKEFSAGLDREGEPLYDSVALSGLYETMGLGNHDFDFGPEVTARFIKGFEPPVPFLAANIDVSGEPELAALADAGLIAKSTVITDPISNLDIGVIGAITPRLPNISSPRNVVVDADVAGAVNAEAARLDSEGVNRIVLTSHLQSLAEDRELVPLLQGVDVVVAGGGDELLRNDGDTCMPDDDAVDSYPLVLSDADGNEVPLVTAPGGYRCIGQLDVTFDADGDVVEWSGSSIGVPLDGTPESFAVDHVETPLSQALTQLNESIVGTSDVDLDGRKPSVRTGPTNVGELLAASLLSAGQAGPDFGGQAATVAIQNGGGIRNDAVIPAGDITLADTFDIAPFSNFAVTGEVSRERFKEVLELGVSGLPEAEGRYPQIAGFTMAVDPAGEARQVAHDGDCGLTGAAGDRVEYVELDDGTVIVEDGQVVPGDPVVLATIDFLAKGGDCYPLGDLEFVQVGSSYQQALASFIEDDLSGIVDGGAWPTEGGNATIGAGDSGGEGDDGDDDGDGGTDDGDGGEGGTDDGAGGGTDGGDTEELPDTGLESWMWTVVALTIAAGGAMVYFEARRTSARSLATRLITTRAWIPKQDRH